MFFSTKFAGFWNAMVVQPSTVCMYHFHSLVPHHTISNQLFYWSLDVGGNATYKMKCFRVSVLPSVPPAILPFVLYQDMDGFS